MLKRIINIAIATGLVLMLAGCARTESGPVGRGKVFVPATAWSQGYLSLDLSDRSGRGGLLVSYLDFSGRRIYTTLLNLPSAHPAWGWDLGRGAAVDGRAFYALRIQAIGAAARQITYTFRPVGTEPSRRRGFYPPSG